MGVLVPVARHSEWNRLHLHQRQWDETGDEGHQQLQLGTKNIRCRNGMKWSLSWKRNCEVGPSRVHLNPSFLKSSRIKHTLGTLSLGLCGFHIQETDWRMSVQIIHRCLVIFLSIPPIFSFKGGTSRYIAPKYSMKSFKSIFSAVACLYR